MDDLNIDTQSPLPGTVKYYDQHIIVCSGHIDWPSKIEEEGGFVAALSKAVKSTETLAATRITACDFPLLGGGIDVLVHPLNKRVVGLSEADIPALLRLLQGDKGVHLKGLPLEKPLFLVCSHYNRDARCGSCGPNLHANFKAYLAESGLDNAAEVWRSSHLGGHRFAGVVVCYPSGNWYGRVTVEDIPLLVQAELQGQRPLPKLWRGRMGLTVEEQMSLASGLYPPLLIGNRSGLQNEG